jgi:Ca2+-binding EF-hand superfamily protein
MHAATLLLLASLSPAAVGDGRDLIYVGEARPYRLRLHLRRDGRPADADFDEALERLFRYLDADGDGALDAAELARAPDARQLQQMLQGQWIEPAPAPSFEDLGADPKAGKATPAQLRAYYLRSGAGPLLVEWGWRTEPTDRLTNALFGRLDDNSDEKLSREELAAAESVLRPLDHDRDEMVSVGELDPGFGGVGYTFRSQTDLNGARPDVPFLVVPVDGSAGPVVRDLLRRYDRDGDHKLSRSEIALDKDLFSRLDADGDGMLDEKELAGWLNEPPDAELTVEMGRPAEQDVALAPRKPAGLSARPARNGGLLLGLPNSQIEVFRAGDRGADAAAEKRYADLFRAADTNGDGVLDSKEIFRDPFDMVGVLRVADRDGDGRLTEKEFTDYLEMQKSLASHFTLLTIADRGRSLFEFLDENHDGRLGVRELRTAWARLAPFDRGSGRFGREDIPHQFHIAVGHGTPPPSGRNLEGLAYGPAAEAAKRRRGPLWFQKMDRNGDGDVSPAEFLGPAEMFRKLDADGDGLIDADEAARADALFRKNGP